WDFNLPSTRPGGGGGTNASLVLVNTITNRDGICAGSFTATRTWRAEDSCGNSSTCSQIIQVVDTTPPVLACISNRTVECGMPWTFDTPEATDAGAGTNVTIVIVSTSTNTLCGKTFAATRTWSVQDGCGNSNACSQTVTAIDRTPPLLQCAPSQSVE